LAFDWKWSLTALTRDATACSSSDMSRSCHVTCESIPQEVNPQETVFWRPAEHWCMNHAKAVLYGRRYFWELRTLAVKAGTIDFLPILLIYMGLLCSFLVFYPRICINDLLTLGIMGCSFYLLIKKDSD
jgi:hypothetical protein